MSSGIFTKHTRRIATVASSVLAMDQITKYLIRHTINPEEERLVIRGFFKLVHWHNTGAAWSMFKDSNALLAVVAVAALVGLYFSRHHFEAHTLSGQFALGLIFGGILGNLMDRIFVDHVTDFLYFYIQRRGGPEAYFPAFNIADSGISVGVALIFLISLRQGAQDNAGGVTQGQTQ